MHDFRRIALFCASLWLAGLTVFAEFTVEDSSVLQYILQYSDLDYTLQAQVLSLLYSIDSKIGESQSSQDQTVFSNLLEKVQQYSSIDTNLQIEQNSILRSITNYQFKTAVLQTDLFHRLVTVLTNSGSDAILNEMTNALRGSYNTNPVPSDPLYNSSASNLAASGSGAGLAFSNAAKPFNEEGEAFLGKSTESLDAGEALKSSGISGFDGIMTAVKSAWNCSLGRQQSIVVCSLSGQDLTLDWAKTSLNGNHRIAFALLVYSLIGIYCYHQLREGFAY